MKRPLRTCLGCGAIRDKAELVRLVAEGGRLVVDGAKLRPGRGGYLCRDRACLSRFLTKPKENRLKHVFRSEQRLCLEGLQGLLAEDNDVFWRQAGG